MRRAILALLLGSGALVAFATDADAGGWCYRTRRHHRTHGYVRACSYVSLAARIGPLHIVLSTPLVSRRTSYCVTPSTRTVYRYRYVAPRYWTSDRYVAPSCRTSYRYVAPRPRTTYRYVAPSSYRPSSYRSSGYRSTSYRTYSYRSRGYRSLAARHRAGVQHSYRRCR